MTVIEIKTSDDFYKVIMLPKVVIDFFASWCGPCKTISPFFDELASKPEYAGIKFFKVNSDTLEDVASKCNITSLPTFMAFSKGEALSQMQGANKINLVNFLNSLK